MKLVLPDSCIWIEALRDATSEEAHQLVTLLDASRIVISGIIMTEVLQGVRKKTAFASVAAHLSSIPYVEIGKNEYIAASILGIELKAKGIILPPSDLLIASACLKHNIHIYTHDKHFNHIPGLVQYRSC